MNRGILLYKSKTMSHNQINLKINNNGANKNWSLNTEMWTKKQETVEDDEKLQKFVNCIIFVIFADFVTP